MLAFSCLENILRSNVCLRESDLTNSAGIESLDSATANLENGANLAETRDLRASQYEASELVQLSARAYRPHPYDREGQSKYEPAIDHSVMKADTLWSVVSIASRRGKRHNGGPFGSKVILPSMVLCTLLHLEAVLPRLHDRPL